MVGPKVSFIRRFHCTPTTRWGEALLSYILIKEKQQERDSLQDQLSTSRHEEVNDGVRERIAQLNHQIKQAEDERRSNL
jgi:hypothetical protein